MRFSTLVAAFALMVQATTAFAGNDSGPVEGEVPQRRERAQPPAAQEDQQPGPAGDESYYDGEGEPAPQVGIGSRDQVVIRNQRVVGGVTGQYYTPGYGGLPPQWQVAPCQVIGENVVDRYTGAPLVNIVAYDPVTGAAYRLLPEPLVIGPLSINVIRVFNRLIADGVCAPPFIPEPRPQPQWGPLPVFEPYRGVQRAPVPVINPLYNYNRGVYRPQPGWGRNPGGPIAVPGGMRPFPRPYGR